MRDDESQIIELLEHKTKNINTIDDKWISEWATLIEKYFKNETRDHIRLKAIALMSQIFSKYHVIYEEELMNKIILLNFSDAEHESNSVVRKPIVHLLFDIATACISDKHCNAILAIVRKILTKPFKQRSDDLNGSVYVINNADIIDSRLIVTNLSKLFKSKMHRLPIDSAVNMLDMSVNYLNLTYKNPLQDPAPAEIPMIRRELFTLFLNLRCNKYGHLGVILGDQTLNSVEYSPFIICVKKPRTLTDQTPSPKPESPTQTDFHHSSQNHGQPNAHHMHHSNLNHPIQHQSNSQLINSDNKSIFVPNASHPNCPIVSRCVSLDSMFAGIIECINQETDLDVLKFVLDGLPGLLVNKSLVLTATDERINQLTLALSNIITTPGRVTKHNSRIDIVKCSLKCLTNLLIYRKSLEHKSIKAMLAAFGESLKVSKNPVVPLFTTCIIELQDSSEMAKFVPPILDRLSKFSSTPDHGIGMLEFLSYLILFPKLYENFSADEYKFIFASALPYTNPFRFSNYITCLAFRVIAMWYLKCRPSHRCSFVEFVKKSLQSNVIQPFKENLAPIYSHTSSPITQTPPVTYSCPATMSPVDQRKRSLSLNTENCFRFHNAQGFPTPQLSLQVNEELIETFTDLLSRYTHGQYLAVAPKNRFTELLLDRSTSQTWLIGHSLVTITAGCANNGWAEVMIRRPTGNTNWIGRIQNTVGSTSVLNQEVYTDSLNFGNDVISLFTTMSPQVVDDNDSVFDTITLASNASSTTLNTKTPSVQSLNNQKSREPILLPKDQKYEVSLSNFDHITPYETHKVGVVFVAKNQVSNRVAILSNKCGSLRYHQFLNDIGTCIPLDHIDPEVYFVGGLDVRGEDGKFAYFWKDNVTQIIFHVATFMTNRESDPQCNNKNRHIGNDHVCIVYNDSGEAFKLSTIKGTGQLIMACIIIIPLDEGSSIVEVEVLPELKPIVGEIEPKVMSYTGASIYARQLAIHLNLASKIHERRHCESYNNNEPYVSNWVERLRCIKRIRQRLEESRRSASSINTVSGGSMK